MVAQNEETLQTIISVKIIQNLPYSGRMNRIHKNEYMLALSNRMQKIVNNDFNFNDINFRILGANVKNLIKNTRCANSKNQNNNQNKHKNQAH